MSEVLTVRFMGILEGDNGKLEQLQTHIQLISAIKAGQADLQNLLETGNVHGFSYSVDTRFNKIQVIEGSEHTATMTTEFWSHSQTFTPYDSLRMTPDTIENLKRRYPAVDEPHRTIEYTKYSKIETTYETHQGKRTEPQTRHVLTFDHYEDTETQAFRIGGTE